MIRLILFGGIDNTYRLKCPGDLPLDLEALIWTADTPVLLVPHSLDNEEEPGNAIPNLACLDTWLRILDGALNDQTPAAEINAIIEYAQGLLNQAHVSVRSEYLHTRRTLRIISVRDVSNGRQRAVSFNDIEMAFNQGTLFGYGQGISDTAAARAGRQPVVRHRVRS